MDLPPIGPQTTKRRKPAFRIEPSQFDILKNIFAVLHVTPALFLSSADHSTILEKLNDVQGGAPLLAAHAAHTVEFRKRVDAKYGEWLCPQPAQPKPPGQPRTINPRAPRMLAAAANLAAYELNKEAKEKESTDREKANRDRWSEVEARARTLLAQPVATNVSSWNDERFQDSLSDQDEIDVEAGRLFAEISAEVATMNRSRHAAEFGAMTETLVALSTLRSNFSRMKPSQPESEMALPSPLFFSTSQTPKGKRRDAPLSEKPREKQRRTDRGWGSVQRSLSRGIVLPPVAPTLVQPQAGPANTAIEELEATVARQTADLCATLHTLQMSRGEESRPRSSAFRIMPSHATAHSRRPVLEYTGDPMCEAARRVIQASYCTEAEAKHDRKLLAHRPGQSAPAHRTLFATTGGYGAATNGLP